MEVGHVLGRCPDNCQALVNLSQVLSNLLHQQGHGQARTKCGSYHAKDSSHLTTSITAQTLCQSVPSNDIDHLLQWITWDCYLTTSLESFLKKRAPVSLRMPRTFNTTLQNHSLHAIIYLLSSGSLCLAWEELRYRQLYPPSPCLHTLSKTYCQVAARRALPLIQGTGLWDTMLLLNLKVTWFVLYWLQDWSLTLSLNSKLV